jgi:hypothetical protein
VRFSGDGSLIIFFPDHQAEVQQVRITGFNCEKISLAFSIRDQDDNIIYDLDPIETEVGYQTEEDEECFAPFKDKHFKQ